MENCIETELRYSMVDEVEYNVFSLYESDPSNITDWVFLHVPKKVMMDRRTFDDLKGNRLRWIKDHYNKTMCEVFVNVEQKEKD